MAAATTFAPAHALREPRRVDWRAVFGGFLFFVAVAGSIAFWGATSDTREVLVAVRELPPGAVLTDGDLTSARVRLDDAMYRAAVPASERSSLVASSPSPCTRSSFSCAPSSHPEPRSHRIRWR